jgi:hypothetical protein
LVIPLSRVLNSRPPAKCVMAGSLEEAHWTENPETPLLCHDCPKFASSLPVTPLPSAPQFPSLQNKSSGTVSKMLILASGLGGNDNSQCQVTDTKNGGLWTPNAKCKVFDYTGQISIFTFFFTLHTLCILRIQ